MAGATLGPPAILMAVVSAYRDCDGRTYLAVHLYHDNDFVAGSDAPWDDRVYLIQAGKPWSKSGERYFRGLASNGDLHRPHGAAQAVGRCGRARWHRRI